MRTIGSKRDTTWPVIRDTAISLIHEHGFDGMNVRLLASEARLQAGSLYNYFKSKEELLSMIVCAIMEDLLENITSRLETCDTPVARLTCFIDVMVTWHTEHRKEAFVAHMEVRNVSENRYDEYVGLRQSFRTILQKILEDGERSNDFVVRERDITCLSILSTLAAIPNWYRESGRLSPADLVDWHVRAFFNLLRAEPGVVVAKTAATRRRTKNR
jgi:AcrR family transcriptional regulator